MHSTPLPPLRPVEIRPFTGDDGMTHFALLDASGVAPKPMAVSGPGYFVLAHCDGRHTAEQVQAAFQKQFGMQIATDQIETLVAALDEGLFLLNERYEAAYATQLAAYRAAEARDNRERYPASDALRAELENILMQGTPLERKRVEGLIAPHLDYPRGTPCYADAYATLAAAPPAERYVILGTNHFGRSSAAVATVKDFDTPLGRVKTDAELVRELEARLDAALTAHEMDHAAEHSIELQVHFLQLIRPASDWRIVPILCPDPCGPTGKYPYDGDGPELDTVLDTLRTLLDESGTETVVIAGADLSHVGAHFGDAPPTDTSFLEEVRANDQRLLEMVARRREDEFVADIAAHRNHTRICSAGCIYGALRLLPERDCSIVRYHQAVDFENETHVTCCAGVIGT